MREPPMHRKAPRRRERAIPRRVESYLERIGGPGAIVLGPASGGNRAPWRDPEPGLSHGPDPDGTSVILFPGYWLRMRISLCGKGIVIPSASKRSFTARIRSQ